MEGSRIRREFPISKGRLLGHGQRGVPEKADYVLQYRNRNLAVIEAKKRDSYYTEGVAQAKDYTGKLQVRFTYSTNGLQIYCIDMLEGKESDVVAYPTPDELWEMTFDNEIKSVVSFCDTILNIPYETKGGTKPPRYYQEIAVSNVIKAVANNKNRILLTLATGTGKTDIAFQISWKLFKSKWNLKNDWSRSPRILFLADRNTLANQALGKFNEYAAFAEDALVRINPADIKKKGKVPTNGNIFFTIFQTFMCGGSTSSPTTQNSEDYSNIEFDEIKHIKNANGYMYILECSNGSFYIGSTKNLKLRLEQHKNGEGAEFTRNNLPLKLVYFETFDRIDFAFDREKQVQKWSRAKKIALIKKDFDLLKKLAKNKSKQEPKVGELTEPYYGELVEPYFGEYPPDFFDFIIIDECHRGGANDESAWRDIMEYFSPAVQLGLTATPKRKQNIDTYKYFGEPVYIYSLKQGINDGFLTPFKVRQIDTTIDEYIYTSDDTVIEGEIEEGKRYTEEDMNRVIEIRQREEYRVKLFMGMINQDEKTLVFCASQLHALAIRDLVNQFADSKNPNYCHRVTADDGKLGEQHLSEFQDNEKIIPTILTTSQKLSTGVDTPEVKNIVLLRPVKQLIEFKQIIGRGTRLYDGKDYFTIYDFVKAHYNFSDPEWDGEPLEPEMPTVKNPKPYSDPVDPGKTVEESDSPKKMIKVKLPDGKVREFQHIVKTSFWSPDGKPISAEEFLQNLFGTLPEFFKNEDELRKIWSKPDTRKKLLVELNEKGISKSQLNDLQKMIHAEKSDLFDVLAYVAFSSIPLERSARAEKVKIHFNNYDSKQQIFLDFVLKQYVNSGVEELDDEKLPNLLELKYSAITDAKKELGDITSIRNTFIGFQPYLYDNKIAI